MAKIIGNLTGPQNADPDPCHHECAHCGKKDTNLFFAMTRDAVATAYWINPLSPGLITQDFRVKGISGGPPYGISLDPVSDEPPVIPPPPPEVWLLYKHGGRYHSGGDSLQGIYDSRDGAMEAARFAVKDERRSLAERLGQPMIPHHDEESVLKWQPGHHWRYGPIPGEYHASAGIADFCVKSYKVPAGYLPDTTWCKVPHVIEGES
jgi:hypothetical protein